MPDVILNNPSGGITRQPKVVPGSRRLFKTIKNFFVNEGYFRPRNGIKRITPSNSTGLEIVEGSNPVYGGLPQRPVVANVRGEKWMVGFQNPSEPHIRFVNLDSSEPVWSDTRDDAHYGRWEPDCVPVQIDETLVLPYKDKVRRYELAWEKDASNPEPHWSLDKKAFVHNCERDWDGMPPPDGVSHYPVTSYAGVYPVQGLNALWMRIEPEFELVNNEATLIAFDGTHAIDVSSDWDRITMWVYPYDYVPSGWLEFGYTESSSDMSNAKWIAMPYLAGGRWNHVRLIVSDPEEMTVRAIGIRASSSWNIVTRRTLLIDDIWFCQTNNSQPRVFSLSIPSPPSLNPVCQPELHYEETYNHTLSSCDELTTGTPGDGVWKEVDDNNLYWLYVPSSAHPPKEGSGCLAISGSGSPSWPGPRLKGNCNRLLAYCPVEGKPYNFTSSPAKHYVTCWVWKGSGTIEEKAFGLVLGSSDLNTFENWLYVSGTTKYTQSQTVNINASSWNLTVTKPWNLISGDLKWHLYTGGGNIYLDLFNSSDVMLASGSRSGDGEITLNEYGSSGVSGSVSVSAGNEWGTLHYHIENRMLMLPPLMDGWNWVKIPIDDNCLSNLDSVSYMGIVTGPNHKSGPKMLAVDIIRACVDSDEGGTWKSESKVYEYVYAFAGPFERARSVSKYIVSNPSHPSSTTNAVAPHSIVTLYINVSALPEDSGVTHVLVYRRNVTDEEAEYSYIGSVSVFDADDQGYVKFVDTGEPAEADPALGLTQYANFNHDEAPSAKLAMVADGRLFLACLNWSYQDNRWNAPLSVAVSRMGEPWYFPAEPDPDEIDTDGFTVDLSSIACRSSEITCIGTFAGRKFILCNAEAFLLMGTSYSDSYVLKVADIGCVSARTFASYMGRAVWLSAEEGFVMYDGESLQSISRGIIDHTKIYLKDRYGDWLGHDAAVIDDHYYFYCNYQNSPVTFVYSFANDSWVTHYHASGAGMAGIAVSTPLWTRTGADQPYTVNPGAIYGISSINGYAVRLYDPATNSDLGNSISYEIETSDLDIGGITNEIQTDSVSVGMSAANNVPVSMSVTSTGTAGQTTTPVTLLGLGTKKRYRENCNVKGTTVSVKLSYTGGSPPAIYDIGIRGDELPV